MRLQLVLFIAAFAAAVVSLPAARGADRITPQQSGPLMFLLNSTHAEEVNSSGGVTVLIERE
jgi:hypothetical protein